MSNEFILVRFPRKRGLYQVTVTEEIEAAIERLEANPQGYYDLVSLRDEPVLRKHARLTVKRSQGAKVKSRPRTNPRNRRSRRVQRGTWTDQMP